MVYVHGTTLLGASIAMVNIGHYRWLPIVMFRGLSSLCLPAFAGYYVRAEVGPALSLGRLPSSFLKKSFGFFVIAASLEALRLLGTTLSFSFIFNWQALHFIALAMFVTYGILTISPKVLLPFFIAVLVLRVPLQSLIPIPSADPAGYSADTLSLAYWLWAAVFGFLVMSFVMRVVKAKLIRAREVSTTLSVLVFAMTAFAAHAWLLPQPRSLVSLLTLTYSIFLPHPTDDNYWSFFVCYPIFMFGYYARAILFNSAYKRYFPLVILCAAGLAGYFMLHGFTQLEQSLPAKSAFSKSAFSMSTISILGICAANFLIFVAIYYLMRSRELTGPLRWLVHSSRSVLMIYLVHEIIFVGLRAIFPFEIFTGQGEWATLILLVVLMHVGYFISLIVANIFLYAIESRHDAKALV